MPSFIGVRNLWSGVYFKILQIHFYHLHIVIFVLWMSLIPISERLIECTECLNVSNFTFNNPLSFEMAKKYYHSPVPHLFMRRLRTSKWRKSVEWIDSLFFPVPIPNFQNPFIYENIEMYPYPSLIPYSHIPYDTW